MGEMFIASTGYTGEDGYEVMLLANEAEAHVECPEGSRRRPLRPRRPRHPALWKPA
jgi:hypothetical protein